MNPRSDRTCGSLAATAAARSASSRAPRRVVGAEPDARAIDERVDVARIERDRAIQVPRAARRSNRLCAASLAATSAPTESGCAASARSAASRARSGWFWRSSIEDNSTRARTAVGSCASAASISRRAAGDVADGERDRRELRPAFCLGLARGRRRPALRSPSRARSGVAGREVGHRRADPRPGIRWIRLEDLQRAGASPARSRSKPAAAAPVVAAAGKIAPRDLRRVVERPLDGVLGVEDDAFGRRLTGTAVPSSPAFTRIEPCGLENSAEPSTTVRTVSFDGPIRRLISVPRTAAAAAGVWIVRPLAGFLVRNQPSPLLSSSEVRAAALAADLADGQHGARHSASPGSRR